MTALPPSSDFTTTGITKGSFKTALTSLRAYLSGLLGDAGTQAAALSALGVPLNATVAKTGAYTVVAADRGKLIDCTTGTWTLAIDAVATLGAGFSFAVRNSGSGTITINPNLSEQIDDATSITVLPGESFAVTANVDATEWRTVGHTPGSTIDGRFDTSFAARLDTTGAQTITSAGALTIAHSLGVVPRLVAGWLTCTSAEYGYAVGEVLAADMSGVSLRADGTALYITFSSAASVFTAVRLGSGATVSLTNTNWTFSVEVMA